MRHEEIADRVVATLTGYTHNESKCIKLGFKMGLEYQTGWFNIIDKKPLKDVNNMKNYSEEVVVRLLDGSHDIDIYDFDIDQFLSNVEVVAWKAIV